MHCIIKTPVGNLKIVEENGFITEIEYTKENVIDMDCEILKTAKIQLQEYFAGVRKTFNLPLNAKGTEFQKRVWYALTRIPYGRTCSYQDIAAAIGSDKACRAVGMANNKNPLMIVVPCHRVIGKNGSMTGYASGIAIKERLLEMEKEVLFRSRYSEDNKTIMSLLINVKLLCSLQFSNRNKSHQPISTYQGGAALLNEPEKGEFSDAGWGCP